MSRLYFKVPVNVNRNKRNLEKYLLDKMTKAMMHVEALVKKKLSRSQPVKTLKNGKKIGLNPSRPGEPPKQVTTKLKQSVAGRAGTKAGRVVGRIGILKGRKSIDGVSVDEYAYELEFDPKGRLNGKRPFLWSTLKKSKRKIIRFFK